MGYRKKDWTWHLLVDGRDMGLWAAKEGGGVDSDDSTYDDWDDEIILGGKATRDNVTLKKLYREDVHANYRFLDERAGEDNGEFTLTGSPTGGDGVAWGDPIVMTGKLKAVKGPDMDKSSSDGGELEIELKPRRKLA